MFKKGDIVRCVNATDTAGRFKLVYGNLYEVEALDEGLVTLVESDITYNINRFTLVERKEENMNTEKYAYLRSGRIIQLRNGYCQYVVGAEILSANMCSGTYTNVYKDDLTHIDHPELDVMSVYEVTSCSLKEISDILESQSPLDYMEIVRVWERPLDWSKVEKDTLVEISVTDKGWIPRYFAEYTTAGVVVYGAGATSITAVRTFTVPHTRQVRLYQGGKK